MKTYRVIETTWIKTGRSETDIGCKWKSEVQAKKELREIAIKFPARQFSLQRQK